MSTNGRVPPHNEEAERAVLGGLLLAGERVAEVADELAPSDFYSRRNAILFESLRGLSEKGVPIDYVSVGEALRANGQFQQLGGTDYLLELSQCVTSPAHIPHHADIVRSTSFQRRLAKVASSIVQDAYDSQSVPDAIERLLDASERKLLEVTGACLKGAEVHPLSELAPQVVRSILDPAPPAVELGLSDIDQRLGGFRVGELVVVAARPGAGKTAFALQGVLNAAAVGKRCLVVSLEMPSHAIVQRLLSNIGEVDSMRIRTHAIEGAEVEAVHRAEAELSQLPVFIADQTHTLAQVRGLARRLARDGLDLIVVDYLQLLGIPGVKDRYQEVSAVSRGLKALATELGVPVMALSQLNRQGDEFEEPRLQHLRETGQIEQDADSVIMLWAEKESDSRLNCSIAKNRHGQTGKVTLSFLKAWGHIRLAAPVSEPIWGGARG